LGVRFDWKQNAEVCLILGVIFLGLGIMPLLSGLYGYYVTVPDVERSHEAIEEAAEELGLGEIPGSSYEDHLSTFFIAMIVVGCSMVVVGTVLVSFALSRKRQMRDA